MTRRMREVTFASLCLVYLLRAGDAHGQAVGCTLSVEQPGELAASIDGLTLGSQEDGGREARVRIQTTLDNLITIDPPTLAQAPIEFDASGQSLEVAYEGTGAFAGVTQTYTTSVTGFQSGGLRNDTIEIDARSVTANGVVAGTYRLQVVVTCS